ncbi:MAG: hypothetical protein ACNA78_00355 [Balneolaceae bacterium]
MSKGLKKEDLEQDILIEYSSRFVHYYEQNKATVLGSAVGIVAVIGLLIGYFMYMNQQENQAQILLGTAEEALMMGNYNNALYGDETEFTIGFVQIANNFGSTSAGNLARYYAAVSEFELGNAEDALTHIEQFNVPRGIVGVPAKSLHAIILSELGRYGEAARKFEEAARWNINPSTTPYNLYEAAIAHREAGNDAEALRLTEEILAEFGNSQQAVRAERLKGRLTHGG